MKLPNILQFLIGLWEANPKLKRKVITVARRLMPKIRADQEAQRRDFRRQAGLPDDDRQD